jgi:glycosyltransferase involved in cell wall biosynthesis
VRQLKENGSCTGFYVLKKVVSNLKILLLNSLYDPIILGGAERSVQFLAEAIADQHEVVLVTLSREKRTSTTRQNGVLVYRVGIKNLYWPFHKDEQIKVVKPLWHLLDSFNPYMKQTIEKIIQIENPNIIHTNNLLGFSVSIWEATARHRTPLVHTIRDYYLLCPRSSMFRNNQICTKQCIECQFLSITRKRTSKHVNAVVANSKFIMDMHLKMGFFRRSSYQQVIYNAYTPPQSISPISETAPSLPLNLGYIGRLDQPKGIDWLLDFITSHQDLPVKLWVAGKSAEAHYEEHLTAKYQNASIEFLGYIKPAKFFEIIDLLIVPSLWHDPLPRTIYEAYAHGVPVIGSNRGGIPEIIKHGKTGEIFEPSIPDALSSVINRFIDAPSLIQQMRGNCLEEAKLFLPDTITTQYISLYQQLINNHP